MKHIQIQNITLQRKNQRGMTMIEVAIAVGLSQYWLLCCMEPFGLKSRS